MYRDNLDKTLDFKDVKIGEWIIVIYEGKNFLRKVLRKKFREVIWHYRVTRF